MSKSSKFTKYKKSTALSGAWLPELGSKMSVASKALCSNAFKWHRETFAKAKLTVVRIANNDC